MNNPAMNDRLREAYNRAVGFQHSGTSAALHVGNDVWVYLRDICSEEGPAFPERNLWYGFPVVPERGWPAHWIQVKTTTVIA